MTTNDSPVTVLGMGAMGSALAAALVKAGHPTTVWNRTPGRAPEGTTVAGTAREALRGAPVVVVCLLDHAAVWAVLDPLGGELAGRVLLDVTTTTPAQARELAAWAAAAGADYVDGGVMAVPSMIGGAGSSVLCSGAGAAFARCRPVVEVWGSSVWLGEDPGLASLSDLALLAGMYVMFAGFLHGAAMVAPAGVSAGEFAGMAAPWLRAMTSAFEEFAAVVDGGDFTVAGQQSLDFSDLGDILAAGAAQGLDNGMVAAVQRLIRRQVDAGHGHEGFARIVESIRQPA